ncbi:MAG: sulfurtransferase TusA family protein [Firmicutes bacterium]|nr:sulfurtransferase TusA family protein [Bacillota bacterium]
MAQEAATGKDRGTAMRTLDVRGEICPYPMMRTVEVLRQMPLEEAAVLEVLTDHPPALESIPLYVSTMGYRCTIDDIGGGTWRIRITRAGPSRA